MCGIERKVETGRGAILGGPEEVFQKKSEKNLPKLFSYISLKSFAEISVKNVPFKAGKK